MNSPAPIPSDAATTPATPGEGADPAARRQRHLDMLDRLAELGMALAEEIGRKVAEGPPPAIAAAPANDADASGQGDPSCDAAVSTAAAARPTQFHHDLALAFDRAARAVRMTIGLYDQMTAAPRGQGAAGEDAPKTLEDLLEELDNGLLRRTAIEDAIGAAARAGNADEAAVARLVREGQVRMSNRETYGDIFNRPLEDVVAQVCDDLGLAARGRRRVAPVRALEHVEDDYPEFTLDLSAPSSPYRGGGP